MKNYLMLFFCKGTRIGLCFIVLTVLLSITGIHCTKDNGSDQVSLNQQDGQFSVMASYGNWNEVGAGALAAAKGTNPGVKMFGMMMVQDHGTAQDELRAITYHLGLSTPQGPDSLHVAMMEALSAKSGLSFDSSYIRGQITDHQATIALFQSEIAGGLDSSLIKYAQKYLPKIQMHLMMADSLILLLHH